MEGGQRGCTVNRSTAAPFPASMHFLKKHSCLCHSARPPAFFFLIQGTRQPNPMTHRRPDEIHDSPMKQNSVCVVCVCVMCVCDVCARMCTALFFCCAIWFTPIAHPPPLSGARRSPVRRVRRLTSHCVSCLPLPGWVSATLPGRSNLALVALLRPGMCAEGLCTCAARTVPSTHRMERDGRHSAPRSKLPQAEFPLTPKRLTEYPGAYWPLPPLPLPPPPVTEQALPPDAPGTPV